MICNQLTDATNALFQLTPKPSIADITRVVCGSCNLTASCPNLKLEQAEWLEQRSVNDSAAKPARRKG